MKKVNPIVIFAIAILAFISINMKGQGLTSLGGGVTTYGYINAFTYDSINNIFYAGGAFNYIDGVKAKNLAKWNGNKWQAIIDSMDGYIYSMISTDGKLYVGGSFSHINNLEIKNIAIWDGIKWIKVGDELNNPVVSLIYFKNNIHAITLTENTNVVVKLENNKWNKELEFNTPYPIKVSTCYDKLCLLGSFSKVNDTLANNVIEYDGNKITYLPMPFDVALVGRPCDAIYFKDTLYLKSFNTIQKLVNNNWIISSNIYGQRLFEYKNNLCVVQEGNNPLNSDEHILKLAKVENDTMGTVLGYMMTDIYKDQSIYSINICNNKLYVSGFFNNFNGNYSSLCLMEFDSINWKNIGKPSFESYVNSFFSTRTYALYNDSVSNSFYIGGKFDFAGGIYSQNISVWNGSNWSNSGDGFNAEVLKILRFKNELYAFGVFTKSGTKLIKGIAKWNGTEWIDIGSGTNRGVLDAKVFNGELYICGYFDTVNGVKAKYVAKFDGMNWSAVGNNNLDEASKRFFEFNGELYIAGKSGYYLGTFTNYTYMAVLKSPGWDYFASPYLATVLGSAVVYNNELYMIDQGMNFCKLDQGGNWKSLATGNKFFNNSSTGPFYPSILIVNNKIWISTQNHEMYLYDNDTLTHLNKNLNPSHGNLNPTSVCNYGNKTILGGYMIGYQDESGAEIKYLNNIGTLEFNNAGFNIQPSKSNICKGDSIDFSLISNDPFAKIKWYFNGGTPDTSIIYNPVIRYPNSGNFNVFVEVNNTLGIDTIFLYKPLNVNNCSNDTDINVSNIIVFPNPTSGLITIKSNVIPNNVRLIDMVGKTILEAVNNNTIDLSSLPRAVYLLSFKIENETYQTKVIKN